MTIEKNSSVLDRGFFLWPRYCDRGDRRELHLVEGLRKVGDDVFDVLDTHAEADQVRSDACFDELFVAELTVGVACRMQHATAGVGHVGHDANHLEIVHELDAFLAATLDTEGEHAAREPALELFLRKFVVLVALEARIVYPGHLRVVLQELRTGESVFAVARHAQVKRFKANVQEERVLRSLDAAEVAHELCCSLRDEGALAESLRVGKAVVARVRFGEALELVVMGFPVKVSAIHDAATHGHRVTVHVLGGGMRHDVHAEFDRAAEYGCRERVIDNHRHAVLVGKLREALQVQNLAGGVSHRFAEEALGVRAESLLDFFVARVLVHERAFDAELLHGHGEEVARAAINGRSADEVVARFADVEHGEEVRCLTGAGEHRCHSAFHGRNLGRHGVVGGVLQARVEVARRLQVEQVGHGVAGLVLESGALVDGENAGFAVFRLPAALDAQSFDLGHFCLLFNFKTRYR